MNSSFLFTCTIIAVSFYLIFVHIAARRGAFFNIKVLFMYSMSPCMSHLAFSFSGVILLIILSPLPLYLSYCDKSSDLFYCLQSVHNFLSYFSTISLRESLLREKKGKNRGCST